MKKSKKAGSYNMRKSLAWDKAFFTEKGVLDPEELSMITGISHGDGLSVVDEEQRDSLSITSDVDSGSADVQTIEESLVKAMSSSPSRKTTMSTQVQKQDSSPGSHLRVISRSSQKVQTGQGLYKSAIKGACSTTRTPSQKRHLNTGTPEVLTRNTKIPRVPLSKYPPSPSTSINAPSGGSHPMRSGIPQPAQKSISLKLPSTTKYASKGTDISSGGTSKSIKQLGATTRMDKACSSLKIDSSANHKAQRANKVGDYLHNSSKQSLPVKLVESVDGTSRVRNVYNPQSDKGDGDKKDVKVQGIKPSGLRMPSPSMRFFSEGNSSNLKSSIPATKNSEAADHMSDFKQIKVRHGSLLHNATSKKRLSSQVTEICPPSSILNPTTHADAVHGNCNRQVLQQVLCGDKVPPTTNDVKCTKNVLDTIDSQHNNETPNPPKAAGKDMKYNVISSHAESMNINSSDPVLQQNGYAVRYAMNSSFVSCPEAQLTVAFASNGDVCPALEDTSCSSSAMEYSESLQSVTDLNSHHNSYTWADRDPLTNMLCDDKTPGKNKMDDVGQPNAGGCLNRQPGGSKLLADGKCSLGIDGSDSAGPVRVGKSVVVEISDGGQQGSISGSERMNRCSTNYGVGAVTHEHVDKEQGDAMYDSELSTMKPGECLVQQDSIGNNHVPYNKNCNIISENRSSSMTSKTCDNKDKSDVDSISNYSKTSFLDMSNYGAALFLDLPLSLQGVEKSPLSSGHGKVDIGCQHASSVSFDCGTEIAINRNIEVTQQVANDDSVGKLRIPKRDNLDVSKDLFFKDSSHDKDQEENFEVSNDMLQMCSRVGGVETQIDSVSNNYAFQTTDLDARLSASKNKDQASGSAVDPILDATDSPNDRHDLHARELMLSATLDVQCNKPDGSTGLEKPEANTLKLVDDLNVERECNLERVDFSDEANANFKRTTDNLKITIPTSNAVPFSDEWLAAIESAGEEILTMKSGAVQHSPPDKSAPDPSPWSPVKRVIGPFDCTKCTKPTNAQLDHS